MNAMTDLTVDVAGGLPAEQDLVLRAAPGDPEFREGVNIWLQDDAGRFAFPRFGVEAIGRSWDRRGVQANIAFPDGRVLVGSSVGEVVGPLDDSGEATVFGAGPIEFRCVEPFRRWTMSFAGPVVDTTVADQVAGVVDEGKLVEAAVEVELTMAVPPWIRGEASDETRRRLAGSDEALFIGGVGGFNCKQLFRATGVLRVGDDEMAFTATGLRVHRKGVRKTADFRGHCWQSAVFPGGRAFEALAFPEPADGGPAYTEGFVFDSGRVYPATVSQAPWMSSFVPHGGDVSLVLDSELGTTRITGLTRASTAMPGTAATSKIAVMSSGASRHNLFFHQGSAEYSWDGESAYGMIERSLPVDKVGV